MGKQNTQQPDDSAAKPEEAQEAPPPVPTLDSVAAALKVEPWKVAAVKAKFRLYGNSELSEAKVRELVEDVEGIRIGVPPEAPKKKTE